MQQHPVLPTVLSRHQTKSAYQHQQQHHQDHHCEEHPPFTFDPILASTLFEQEHHRHRDLHASNKSSGRPTNTSSHLSRPCSSDGENDGGGPWRTGIGNLDAELSDIWKGGSLLGIADVGGDVLEEEEGANEQQNSYALISSIIATHILDFHQDNDEKQDDHTNDVGSEKRLSSPLPSVYLLAQPHTSTSLMNSIYDNLTRKLEHNLHTVSTNSTPSTTSTSASDQALQLLSSLSLMQYLDLTGLSEITHEISSSLSSQTCLPFSTTSTRRKRRQQVSDPKIRSRKVLIILSGLPEVLNNSVINRANLSHTAALLTLILRNLRDIVNIKTLICPGHVGSSSTSRQEGNEKEMSVDESAQHPIANEEERKGDYDENDAREEHVEIMAIVPLLATFTPSTSTSTSTFSPTNTNVNIGNEPNTLPSPSHSTTTPSTNPKQNERTLPNYSSYQHREDHTNNSRTTTEDIPTAFADRTGRILKLCTSPLMPSSYISSSSSTTIAKVHETTLVRMVEGALDILILVRRFDGVMLSGVDLGRPGSEEVGGEEQEREESGRTNDSTISRTPQPHNHTPFPRRKNNKKKKKKKSDDGEDTTIIVEIVKDRLGSSLGSWCIWS